MTQETREALTKIAMSISGAIEFRGDLETRDNDKEDFVTIAVWSIMEMLEEAYNLGKKEG